MLELYFSKFREQIIGLDATIDTPYHEKLPVVYADWTASGRNLKSIEKRMAEEFMPLVANTHTETTSTGTAMTYAYKQAKGIIKTHVNASDDDVFISCGSGMTGAINKFQRILGLRVHERYKSLLELTEEDRPIVFVTHMEHHSNQTSWLETIADVRIVEPNKEGLVCLESFEKTVAEYANRKTKIAAITSCSNVTGIMTNYHAVAKIMHQADGYCFVDFACSAPYVDINMHPLDESERLDAIYFSPHKFLGGPGTTGVLVFNKKLYTNQVPDNPGGGTVDFTNPWGGHKFVDDIEAREDGGTPPFLQTIKIALCVKLKEQMSVEKIQAREHELLDMIWPALCPVENLHILAMEHKNRLGVFSFYIDGLHYNIGVKMLNDRYGIQTRGGCSCAGTYGHYLLNVDSETSKNISDHIESGDCSLRPGWIRMSIHPTTTDAEMKYILESIKDLAENFPKWMDDYTLDGQTTSVSHKNEEGMLRLKARMDDLLKEDLA